MLRKANNVFSVLLDDETVTTLPAEGAVVTAANLGNGAVVLTDQGLRRLSAAAFTALGANDKFMLVQGKGASEPLMKSPVITKGTYSTSISTHSPAVQQVTTIGYNGTSGSLPAANDTSYYIKIRKNDNDAGNRSQPFSIFGQFKTDSSATQEEVALGLALNLKKNLDVEAAGTNGYLAVDLLCDEAGGAIGAAADTVVGTAGEYTVVVTDTGADLSVNAIAVGDLFRAGTAVTDPVYKVTASTVGTGGGTLTLDRPLNEDVSLLGTTSEFITEAASAAAEFGIVLTGVESDFDVNKFRDYYANRFTATFSDEDTLVTATTGARNGVGVWQQVAMDEYMTYGYEGQNEMLATPPTMRDQAVKIPGVGGATAATSKYSALNITWTESITGVVGNSAATGNVILYTNLDGSGNLGTSGSSAETLVTAMGLTPADFDE
jgi:hypothetical protein